MRISKKINAFFLLALCLSALNCTDIDNPEETGIGSGGPEKPSSLDAWLDENTVVKEAIRLEGDGSSYLLNSTLVDSGWDDWSEVDKQALRDAFDRAWVWLYQTQNNTNNLGSDEFTMPLPCSSCESNLTSSPSSNPLTLTEPSSAKTVYFAFVAHSLAIEAGGALDWSLEDRTPYDLFHIFNSRSLMHVYGSKYIFGSPNFAVNERVKYNGNSTPATPRYAYAFLSNNNLIRPTRRETIEAVLEWSRDNMVHFFGASSYSNMNDHWGYPSRAPVNRVLDGTVRSGESQPRHWTAGCHGTNGTIKMILRALNIPTELLYVCGHSQMHFLTEHLYMDHGDNPYNANVRASSAPISGLLIDHATHQSWFTTSPDFLASGSPECVNIGKAVDDNF